MPRLSDTMEEGTVAKWLKKVGDKIEEGDILAEIETDKATMEFESFNEGTLLYIGIPFFDTYIGTVATWLKKVGDEIEEGDILAEIETDKATMEFESFYSGTLLYVGINEGETAPVDAVLAVIGPKGTDVDAVLRAGSGSTSEETAPEETKKAETASENDQQAAPITANDGQRIFASPLAKKIAQDKGINLEDVKGSGDQGRIIKKDIEEYQPKQKAAEKALPAQDKASSPQAAVAAPINLPVGQEGSEEVKNSQMRKVIAKRLGESKFSAPHYYLTIEVDMDYAKVSREQINSLPDTKVSFNDMVVKACAMALKKHPQVNTSWNNETTRYNHHVHIGVAVAVDEGLLVPVLKFADQMTLTQIGATVKDLAGKARNKKISPAEMEGSTFTVSNLGMFGISEFTSIINQPNSAILSVGAIVQKPVVKNGQIVVGNTMKVTLACDHRTVDGATGAQFLQTLRAYLENPVTMLA